MKTDLLHPNLVHRSRLAGRPARASSTTLRHTSPQGFTASLRVPVSKHNRDYLRALRAAELAAWERADRRSTPNSDAQPDAAGATRTPDAGPVPEMGAFALLMASAGFAVAHAVWFGAHLSPEG